jgi:transcriptional regulator with XRE-family HTH domain
MASRSGTKRVAGTKANAADVIIGRNLRAARERAGLSQQHVADRMGVSLAQMRRYESGAERINARALGRAADILAATLDVFFKGLASTNRAAGRDDPVKTAPASTAEGHALNRAFSAISDPVIRRRIVDLLEAIAEQEVEEMLLAIVAKRRGSH